MSLEPLESENRVANIGELQGEMGAGSSSAAGLGFARSYNDCIITLINSGLELIDVNRPDLFNQIFLLQVSLIKIASCRVSSLTNRFESGIRRWFESQQ